MIFGNAFLHCIVVEEKVCEFCQRFGKLLFFQKQLTQRACFLLSSEVILRLLL